jgi:fermentation-respiration switch protein FrsA (DUF1100 family)
VADISPRGLLLIAPEDDRLVSSSQSRALYQRAGEPKELFLVRGAEHSEARTVAGLAYERRVLGFLGRHLDREASRAGPAQPPASVKPGTAPV